MIFEFTGGRRVIFGEKSISKLPELAKTFGNRVLIVTGARPARFEPFRKEMEDAELECEFWTFPEEPSVERVQEGVMFAQQVGIEVVVGFGGGSAIDGGKAIAALLANPGDPFDYLEVVGKGLPLKAPSIPFIAIPTTAGTGSEVTKNAVLFSPKHRVKASLRSHFLLPSISLLDPELTYSLPRDLTIITGLDALTQLIEPFV